MIDDAISIKYESQKVRDNPVASYKPLYRGQAAFLMDILQEKEIRAVCSYGRVRIYSKKKVDDFVKAIKESLEKHNERFGLTYPLHKYYRANELLCVGLKCHICNECGTEEKDEDWLYTYGDNFARIVVNQYIGAIPTVPKVKIFASQIEMLEYLLTNKKIIVQGKKV